MSIYILYCDVTYPEYLHVGNQTVYNKSSPEQMLYNMGRSSDYGRNSNILIPDPYH